MIHSNIEIRNPTKWINYPFKNINICKFWNLSEHKIFEFQLATWDLYNLFEFDLDLIWWGRDHAGPEISIELLGMRLDVRIYDTRHWQENANTWEEIENKVII
jgi:hypothetical protein